MTRAVVLTAIGALLSAATAAAQSNIDQRGIDLVPHKATPLQESGITLEGAQPTAPGTLHGAALLDWNVQPLAYLAGETKLGNLVTYRVDGHVLFAYTLLPRLELGVDLPFTLGQKSHFEPLQAAGFEGVSSGGLGDLRILPRVFLLDPRSAPFGAAVVLETRFPTGDERSFLGERTVVFAPRLALEKPIGPVRLIADVGVRIRGAGQFINLYVGNELTAGGGLVLSLPEGRVFRRPEFLAETVFSTQLSDAFTSQKSDSLKTPWEVLAGVRTRFGDHWGAELDVGRGVTGTPGYGREAFRLLASVRFDFGPTPAPAPAAAPPPRPDRDHDGVPDDVDKCPDAPGPAENDGCPDLDHDKDGVPDKEDACPNEPGPKELDGCPDRDGDQIPDREDKCPDAPGPAENDGCPVGGAPLVELESNRIRLRGSVLFDTGKAVIQKQSYGILDEVYAVLSKHRELTPVRVEGHTDDRGSRPYNLDLSERRARAVVDYLVQKGIKRSRLRTVGYGFDRPIAPNDTALGRAKNRRVEFRLLKEGTEKTTDRPIP